MWPGKTWPRRGGARAVLFVALRSDALEWALRVNGRWDAHRSGSLPLQAGSGGIELVADALRALAARWAADDVAHPGAVRIVVADYWLRVATLPWSDAMRRDADTPAYLRMQLAAAGHPVEPDDVIRHGDGLPGRPLLAVIYPAQLWSALLDVQRELDAPVTSVLPCSVLAWSCLPRPWLLRPAMLGASDGTVAMLLRGTGGELQEVTVRYGSMPMLTVLRRRALLREASGISVATDSVLPVVDLGNGVDMPASDEQHIAWRGQAAGAGTPSAYLQLAALPVRRGAALDAVQPVAAITPVRALVTLALLAVTALTAGAAWQTSTRAAALENAMAATSARPAPTAPAAPARRSEAEVARIRQVNLAIRTLNMPIVPLLRAMEPPQDLAVSLLGVQVTEIETKNGHGTLRLVAQALDSGSMTRYVAYLAERRPLLTAAVLTQHEQDDTLPGRPYRFTVEVQWQP